MSPKRPGPRKAAKIAAGFPGTTFLESSFPPDGPAPYIPQIKRFRPARRHNGSPITFGPGARRYIMKGDLQALRRKGFFLNFSRPCGPPANDENPPPPHLLPRRGGAYECGFRIHKAARPSCDSGASYSSSPLAGEDEGEGDILRNISSERDSLRRDL